MQSAREPNVSAVVVSHDSAFWLPDCLRDLLASTGVRLSVCVVDTASTDGSAALVESRFRDVALIRCDRNLGFAGGANLGIRASSASAVIILNPDVTVQPSTLAVLENALAEDPGAAVAGAKLLYPDGKTIQHAGGTLSYPLALADHIGYRQEDRGQFDEPREVDFVTGAAIALRRTAVERIGGFDEGFYPGYFEDADLCLRMRRAGYRVLYVPRAAAIHHESVTTGRNSLPYYHFYHRNRIRFVLKHYSDEELWQGFRPAELRRLRRTVSYVELAALGQAYADNLAVLEDRADFIANPAGAAPLPRSKERLALLRDLQSGLKAVTGSTGEELGALPDRFSALGLMGRLSEPRFVSSVPVIAPLIVRFRKVWNWMSTRWYVGPIVEQQSEFNRLTTDSLQQLDATVRALGSRVAEAEASGIQMREILAALELRLRRIEDRLADVQRTLEEHAGKDAQQG